MAWVVDYHSRLLAKCFSGANLSPGATVFAAYEEKAWEEASSWKGYCERLARGAASLGHKSCLRALHELGGQAAASVAAADADGVTPAHSATYNGHEGCLRVLHELGGEAAASLAAAGANGYTPAHYAAGNGHEGCLRVLHELLCMMIDPQLAMLAGSFASTSQSSARDDLVEELRAQRSLSWTQGTKPFDKVDMTTSHFSPAALAAERGHADCFRFLAEIGGAAAFLEQLRRREFIDNIDSKLPWLLTDPALLDLGKSAAGSTRSCVARCRWRALTQPSS